MLFPAAVTVVLWLLLLSLPLMLMMLLWCHGCCRCCCYFCHFIFWSTWYVASSRRRYCGLTGLSPEYSLLVRKASPSLCSRSPYTMLPPAPGVPNIRPPWKRYGNTFAFHRFQCFNIGSNKTASSGVSWYLGVRVSVSPPSVAGKNKVMKISGEVAVTTLWPHPMWQKLVKWSGLYVVSNYRIHQWQWSTGHHDASKYKMPLSKRYLILTFILSILRRYPLTLRASANEA